MQFINRQQEIKELRGYFENEPSSMLVVYGPKSTGKTTLLNHVIEEHLSNKKYAVNFINLRRVLVYDFASFLDIFFQKTTKDKVREILGGLTLNTGFFQVGLDDEAMLKKNAFKVMEDQLRKANKKGIRPIIIIDEIQSLKEIYMNGERMLLDEVFNFFVGITKETHLAHVVLASSDSFFISEIYDSARLMKTATFLFVNHLKEPDIKYWLEKENFLPEEIQFIWEHSSGSPWETEQYIIGKKQGITVEKSFQKILQFVVGKFDHYLVYKMNDEHEEQLFYHISKKIVKDGRCSTIETYGKSAEKLIGDMVGKDLWFYDGMKREITANSESVRRAMEVILNTQKN